MRLLIALLFTFAAAAEDREVAKKSPNTPPKWNVSKVELGEAFRNKAFEAKVPQEAAMDEQGDALTYRLAAGGPKWLKVAPDGKFSGTPGAKDQGKQTWTLEVKDRAGKAEVALEVEIKNREPLWSKQELNLADSTEEKKTAFDVGTLASDPDKDPLTFAKTDGPAWLEVAPNGKLSGLPPEGSHGGFTALVEASDGEKKSSLRLTGKVIQKNYAPQIPAGLTFNAKEREPFTVDLTKSIQDKNENDKQTFTLKTQKPWATLTKEGVFTAKLGFSEVGSAVFQFSVTDGAVKTDGSFTLVVERNPRAPVWTAEFPVYKMKSREPFKASVTRLAKDMDSIALTFAKKSGKPWLSVSPQGELSGTPGDADAGESDATLSVANDKLSAEQVARFQIEKKNYVPTLSKPLELSLKEREPLTTDLAKSGYVTDPDEETLTYSSPKLPAWVTLTPEGELTLKPAFAQIGQHKFSISVKDREKAVELPVTVAVARSPRPPVWSAVPSFSMKTREPFKGSVGTLVKDPDGLKFKISKVKGPEWLTVTDKGDLSGTPDDASAGDQKVEIAATSDGEPAVTTVTFQITKKNYPPKLVKAFEATIKERDTAALSLNTDATVTDPDKEELTFTSTKLPTWVSLGVTGELTAKPQYAQIGQHKFTVTVKDREQSVDVPVTLTVARNPRPPVWSETPTFSMKTREPFKGTLAGRAKDQDGLAVKFSKVKGPDWLTVAPTGELSGTPDDASAGQPAIEIGAKSDGEPAVANVVFNIEKKNYPPKLVKGFDATVKERDSSALNLATNATVVDPDGENLVFSSTKLPNWVTLAPNGELTAKAAFANIGKHQFTVTAKDRAETVDVPVTITVQRNPRAPVWEPGQPFVLETREPFKTSIAKFAKDLDGLPIKFSRARGPEWIKVSDKGEITGTPSDTDAGSQTLEVSVANDLLPAAATFRFEIEKKNYPPQVVKTWDPTIHERDKATLSISKSGAITDPDGERLMYSAAKLPAWMALTPEGELTASPGFSEIGVHKFTIAVKDRKETVSLPVVLTVARAPRQPIWSENPGPYKVQSREAFKANFGGQVKDLDGQAIKFSKVSGPSWITVSEKGEVTGMPKDLDIGERKLVISAANDGANIQKQIELNIVKKNYPPLFIKAFEATVKEREETKLNLALSKSVDDPDKEDLTYGFAKQAPAWMSLSPEGELTVKPDFAQIGTHKITLTAKDRELGVELPAVITVTRNPRAPEWKQEKLSFSLQTREPFKATVAGQATDLDGLKFTYAKAGGPEWVRVAPSGEITGEPTDAHAGRVELIVSADNKEKASQKTVTLEVKTKNHAPALQMTTWPFQCNERERCRFNVAKAQYVRDQDGDRLSFAMKDMPAWMTMTAEGDIEVQAAFQQIGKHAFKIEVSDPGGEKITAPVTMAIERDPRPPVWNSERLSLTTLARDPIKLSLAKEAKDLDGLALKFTKVSGPDWLTIAPNGALGGKPGDELIGKHAAVVEVANDLKSAKAELTLEVQYKNHAPQWSKNKIELGVVRAGENLIANVRGLASDPDPNSKVVYEKVRGPAWMIVSPDGMIFGRPPAKEVGEQKVILRAVDPQREPAEVDAVVKVDRELQKPAPKENPIRVPATNKGELFGYHLNKAFGNFPYTYALVTGPAWLKLLPTGELTGIPSTSGDYDFSIEVTTPKGEKFKFNGRGKVAGK